MKKILTDADGVLLWWEPAFHDWMKTRCPHPLEKRGTYSISEMYPALSTDKAEAIVREFGNSSRMGFLDPVRDAQQGVSELVKHGYTFDCITSLSTDPYTCALRKMNLRNLYGKDTFEEFVFLDTNASKTQALREYQDTGHYWIEDKPANCDSGLKCGLQPILIDHPYNQWYDNPNVFRVSTWAEIVEIVLNQKMCK